MMNELKMKIPEKTLSETEKPGTVMRRNTWNLTSTRFSKQVSVVQSDIKEPYVKRTTLTPVSKQSELSLGVN